MFGLFKKTSWSIKGKELDFFLELFNQLPYEFQFLLEGLNKGLYRRFSVNHSMKGNFYSVGFDPMQSDNSMVKGRSFELKNIIVRENGSLYPLNLTIYDGLLIGFEIEKNVVSIKNYHFDLSNLRKEKSKFDHNDKIQELVYGLESNKLDLEDLGELEIDGKLYYQIKDLEDGNLIAINEKGHVFWLIHDPYKIELINKSLKDFVKKVNLGQFDFEEYLKK